MSGRQREKQAATTKQTTTMGRVNTRGGRGRNLKEVDSPPRGRRGTRAAAEDEGDACAEAINDALEEMEAIGRSGDVTPPPEKSPRRTGPAAGTADRAKALELKNANEKAVEAEKKAAQLTAELELAKAQLQKERKKRETEKQEEVSALQLCRFRTPFATSRKKAVDAINNLITLI